MRYDRGNGEIGRLTEERFGRAIGVDGERSKKEN